MYQSFIYLETRILLPPVPEVFISETDTGHISVAPEVMKSVSLLVKALNCFIPETIPVEYLTGNFPKPTNGRHLTGYSVKVAEGGSLNIIFHCRPKTIHFEEIRIEEDSGRLTHADGNTHMDYTWAGCPSIRIHTTPSFETGEEAQLFLDELRRLIQYLHLPNEQSTDGSIRCNAFVALSKYPELPDYYVKLRNLNSFNFVRKAINSELTRQENMLTNGGIISAESRIWNEHNNCTEFHQTRNSILRRFGQITPPQTIRIADLMCIYSEKTDVFELPEARRQRFKKQYGVSRLRSEFLCDDRDRADFFEAVVAAGAEPLNAAHWIASELTKLLNKSRQKISEMKISPESYAAIIRKLDNEEIHSAAAKSLLQAAFETGEQPDYLMQTLNISEISGKKELLPYVKKIISENQPLCKRLQHGEMPPLEFLTGLVMKETGGNAVAQTVKALIKQELSISVVYILAMGGSISAVRHDDGSISSGDANILRSMLNDNIKETPVQVISVGDFLSEELEPRDWSKLIAEIVVRINAGTANGIVITHGTDTLEYTAALLFWLFSNAPVPVVLTASSALPSESHEAQENLQFAVRTAAEKKNGVYVAYGGSLYSPLNLHFERPAPDGFRNWNLKTPVFTESGPIALQFADTPELDADVMTRMMTEASGKMALLRVYPGFRSDIYRKLIEENVHTIFIELYETGTGNMRNSDFSLKPLLEYGKQHNARFYCTSQQETEITFSPYTTALRVWREGAVPLGTLTTPSAVALYFACALAADSDTEADDLMETYGSLYTK
jgi:aspartyl-tRNA(Asn)/glutamyl-tRNA(Gln) amidotransferase subunit B